MAFCVGCGKEFAARKRGQKFCTKPCYLADYQRRAYKHRRENPGYLFHCTTCGTEIRTNDPRRKFCSPECNRAFQNAKRKTTKYEDRECPVCGTVFQPMQRRGVGKKYCSKKCSYQERYKRMRVTRNKRSWEYKKRSKWGGNWWAALQRDKFTCRVCNKYSPPSLWKGRRRLVVHHLDGTGEHKQKNHEMDNLLTVCEPCHKLFHTKINLVFVDGEWHIEGEIFDMLGIASCATIWRDGKKK